MERDRIRTESRLDDPRLTDDVRDEDRLPDRTDPERRGAMASWYDTRDPYAASHFDFMRRFMREMSRMFEGLPGARRHHALTDWPPIETYERDNRVVIRAEMPGMRREDVKVRVEDGYLVIKGERKDDREARHEGYYETEWSYGRFSRRVMLPAQVDPEHVHARFENGVLEVTLDVPDRGRREIPIEAAGTDTPRHEGGLRAAVESRNRERESDRSARP